MNSNPRMIQGQLSDFLRYLAEHDNAGSDRLPSLSDLSREMGVSIASLREQLEVARALGFVEVRPKTGIRRLPYTFQPSVVQSLSYAVAIDPDYFVFFADLRRHIETAYWYEAAALLTAGDIAELESLVRVAKAKLKLNPPQIPHAEHRDLHLKIFGKLNHPFVLGILESFWSLYEASGMNYYSDLNYLEKVWQYHERIVAALVAGNLELGYNALVEHMDLISLRAKPINRQNFE